MTTAPPSLPLPAVACCRAWRELEEMTPTVDRALASGIPSVSLPEGCAAVPQRWGPSRLRSMASAASGLSCPIRFLCIHRYAPGVPKGGTSPNELQWLGKRGKLVKKMRLIPGQRAHAIARKLQGTPGVTVSVL